MRAVIYITGNCGSVNKEKKNDNHMHEHFDRQKEVYLPLSLSEESSGVAAYQAYDTDVEVLK